MGYQSQAKPLVRGDLVAVRGFRLLTEVEREAMVGVQHPSLHGCLVRIGPSGLVVVTAPSRERLFDQTARFLRRIGRDLPTLCIAATVITPADCSYAPGSRDAWTITLNADVVFTPGAVVADMPEASTA